ncbi:MAG: hypothetical protein HZA91_14010 [Verrucomicrobia bacterium]|nr:hypothetical protein [Verrucomicrobiota bacterium]
MSEQQQSGNWYVLVWNLKVSAPIQVAPGLTLRPLNAPLTVWDLAATGAVGFREWATLEPFASNIHCELETSKDAAILPGYDALNRAWLTCALLLLRGLGRSLPIAASAYTWQSVAGHQERTKSVFHEQLAEEGVDAAVHSSRRELPRFTGSLLDYHLHVLTCLSTCNEELTEGDAEWIRRHFDKFNKLATSSERFRFALEASNDWRYCKDARTAISRLWAGIECLFGISSELVFRLSLMAASVLQPRGSGRRDCFHRVKKLYGIRSKAVHGDEISEERLAEGLDGSFCLLRDLLIAFVAYGKEYSEQDYEAAIFL